MVMLVTLQEASDDLRRDTDADNGDLILKIKGASLAVMAYCQNGTDGWTDSNGDVLLDSNGDASDVPEDIKIATLLTIRAMYRDEKENEAGHVDSQFGYGYALPRSAIGMLFRYRSPSLG